MVAKKPIIGINKSILKGKRNVFIIEKVMNRIKRLLYNKNKPCYTLYIYFTIIIYKY